MEQNQKIKALEERMHQLEEEVSTLRAKVQNLEATPNVRKASTQQSFASKEKLIVNDVAQQESVEPRDWEKILLQTWLPRVFIFVFIIGVIWGFKAASDYGWLNDFVKIGLGYLTSMGFLLIGYKQMNQKREVLGQVLLGGGIAILILATFAMHSLYGMVGPTIAFVLQILWVVGGAWLTVRFKSQALAMISVVGGFLVPFLIESSNPSIYVFVGYETILFLVFLYLAIQQRFIYLYVTSFVLLNSTLILYYGFSPNIDQAFLLATSIIIQHAVILYFFLTTKLFRKVQAVTVFSSALITYWWVDSVYLSLSVTLFLLLGLATYGVLSYLWKYDKRKIDVLATSGLLYLFLFIFHFVHEDIIAVLLLIQGVASFFIAVKYDSIFNKVFAGFIYFVGMSMVFFSSIQDPWSIESLQWLVLLATFIVGIWIVWQGSKENKFKALTIGGLIFTFLSLVFVSQFTMAATDGLPYETQTIWLSFAWITQAVITIVIGMWKRFNLAKYIGVGLLVLTLVKLILLDLPFIPIQFRALLFIVLGVIGLVASRVFYRKK
ncbi:DUF2339 domain-containing protein [Sutcliffiella halmapala]|uniref:DUF2339 domain-containing protein n=1 Tax=Sutcliffiella halmapala TaxID=79882 RepID=UPI00147444E2|nr:DUF2339 domain-containing protein [Sutcliffiella halmapala]